MNRESLYRLILRDLLVFLFLFIIDLVYGYGNVIYILSRCLVLYSYAYKQNVVIYLSFFMFSQTV